MAEEEAKSSKSAVKRVRGVVIEKPIVVGSMAWPLAKKDETTVRHPSRQIEMCASKRG